MRRVLRPRCAQAQLHALDCVQHASMQYMRARLYSTLRVHVIERCRDVRSSVRT